MIKIYYKLAITAFTIHVRVRAFVVRISPVILSLQMSILIKYPKIHPSLYLRAKIISTKNVKQVFS